MWLGRTTLTVVALWAVLAGASAAGGVTITFEDAAPGFFLVGQTFPTAGLNVTIEALRPPAAPNPAPYALITDGTLYGGMGNVLGMYNVNADFALNMPVSSIALQYVSQTGAPLNLSVNGVNWEGTDFSALHQIGSVQVSAMGFPYPAIPGTTIGSVFLIPSGPITSFEIGGEGLIIDNIIASCVPEPATLGLMGLGGLLIARRRK